MSKKTAKPEQLSRADVESLSKAGKHADIERYRVAGRLDDVLGIVRHYPPSTDQWTRADLDAMVREHRNDEISAAREAGLLDTLLNPNPDAA